MLTNKGAAAASTVAAEVLGDLTIAGWINVDDVTANPIQTIITKDDGTDTPYWLAVTSSGELRFEHSTGVPEVITSAASVVPSGEWMHVAVVRKVGTSVEFFINGKRDIRGAQVATVTPGASSFPVQIGFAILGSDNLAGLVDELAVWSSALSSSEILGLFLMSKRGSRYRVRG